MTARLSRAVLALVALLAAPSLTGCVSDASPLVVESFFSSTVDAQSHVCRVGADVVSRGTLDTDVGQSFQVAMQVFNGMTPNNGTLSTNTRTISIDTVNVTYRSVGGAPVPAPEKLPVGAVVQPNMLVTFVAPLLSSQNGQALAGQGEGTIVAQITLEGATGDGGRVHAAPVEFPIELCAGCVKSICNPDTQVAVACNPAQDPVTGGLLCQQKQ